MYLSLSLGAMLGQASLQIVSSQYAFRAEVQWARILDKPTDIELHRGDVFLPIQTVRIEYDDSFVGEATSEAGNAAVKRLIIFGVRGHPDIDDLDIDEWDTFVWDEKEYTVHFVNRNLIGQLQAEAEAI